MPPHNTPGLRIIAGLDEALKHDRLVAKTHRVRVVRPLPIKQMAQATRDAGMQSVVEERRIDLHRALARNERRLRKPPSFFATLAADAREFCSEVADAPAHHALFAILTITGWTVVLIAPLLIGERLL